MMIELLISGDCKHSRLSEKSIVNLFGSNMTLERDTKISNLSSCHEIKWLSMQERKIPKCKRQGKLKILRISTRSSLHK